MNEISTDQLLQQIRTLGKDLQTTTPAIDATPKDFGNVLNNTLDAINDAQQYSQKLKVDFHNGTGEKTLAEVMIASQKADLSFRAATEVRNKLITAYQDIMNMPV
ncbi:MAG: flagellar hook-basal body complex protein FliE [Pseudomonadota bacterium]